MSDLAVSEGLSGQIALYDLDLLTCVLKEIRGIQADRKEIYTDACGINHFTWITEAKYQNIDLLALLPEFMDRFYEEGYWFAFRHDPFAYGNKVKLDLFRQMCYNTREYLEPHFDLDAYFR